MHPMLRLQLLEKIAASFILLTHFIMFVQLSAIMSRNNGGYS